ncbi:MAG: hypothetical protein BWY59_01530 [Verrucomicrobia bacterium ADurb.Bin345]|nr:MAG: hypothetical protein BWY59_01530 [Verrucomicrobia bacterium ADurb.Bin345]
MTVAPLYVLLLETVSRLPPCFTSWPVPLMIPPYVPSAARVN